ncbi:MAG TPA: ATP-grasp domain-containing protein, partial [Thermomicrobiales bacterium]|nr:ATP-grasp domain-containing protein [Thermomicrobiales bacterium]
LLGVPHNAPDAAVAARDKFKMRSMLAAGGVRCPGFRTFPAGADPRTYANEVTYPSVVKPTRLSGSRGVIRANNADELIAAVNRLRAILTSDGTDLTAAEILIEDYMPGEEVAVEGLLTDGELHVLTIFDKPDPLVGPFFEETIYTTPSRLPVEVQEAIARETAACAAALGLRTGPVHAELRVNEQGPWILEIAGRSIGGLCSTVLSFGAGMCLEELILRHAVGMEIPSYDRTGDAAGVMMIPIPKSGILRSVDGVAEASAVPHIDGIEITAKLNYPIKPLPDGASYLGFIFARADTPQEVEQALRDAHAKLRIRIDPMMVMQMTAAG